MPPGQVIEVLALMGDSLRQRTRLPWHRREGGEGADRAAGAGRGDLRAPRRGRRRRGRARPSPSNRQEVELSRSAWSDPRRRRAAGHGRRARRGEPDREGSPSSIAGSVSTRCSRSWARPQATAAASTGRSLPTTSERSSREGRRCSTRRRRGVAWRAASRGGERRLTISWPPEASRRGSAARTVSAASGATTPRRCSRASATRGVAPEGSARHDARRLSSRPRRERLADRAMPASGRRRSSRRASRRDSRGGRGHRPGPRGGARGESLTDVFTTIELPLVPVLEAMERHGIRVDSAVLADLSARLGARSPGSSATSTTRARGEFNINSPQQLAEVLFERRGLPVLRQDRQDQARPRPTPTSLAELAARGPPAAGADPRVPRADQAQVHLRRRAAAPGRRRRPHPHPLQPGGRGDRAAVVLGPEPAEHPDPHRARTRGPRRLRRRRRAGAGLAADYSQIELRVLAHLAEEPALIEAFARGEDIHRATAALVLRRRARAGRRRPAARRQDRQLRLDLRYERLRPGTRARHPAGRGSAVHRRATSPACRGCATYLDGVTEEARRTGKVTHPVRSRALDLGPRRVRNAQPARQRGATGDQRTDPGHRGGPHEAGHDPPIHERLDARASRPGCCSRSTTSWCSRSPAAADGAAAAALRTAMESVAELRVPLRVDIGHGPSWAAAKGSLTPS